MALCGLQLVTGRTTPCCPALAGSYIPVTCLAPWPHERLSLQLLHAIWSVFSLGLDQLPYNSVVTAIA